MVYKKYIKRGGKTYGPYLYKSVKKDGKVITEYHGRHETHKQEISHFSSFIKRSSNKKLAIEVLSVLSVALLIYLIFLLQFGATGKASVDIQSSYLEGEQLKGQVNLILRQGELFPADSRFILNNSGKNSDYGLRDLVSSNLNSGNFYVENKNISGSGEGFGIPGEKKIYPLIDFVFRVISSVDIDENVTPVSSGGAEETETPEVSTNETTEAPVNETQEEPENVTEPEQPSANESGEPQEPVQDQPTETLPSGETTQPEISEPSSESSSIPASEASPETSESTITITGEVITGEIIQGQVSKTQPYEYGLNEGESVEIVESSQPISFSIENGKAVFITDYSEIEQGFGGDYLGDEKLVISINLSSLNLLAQKGTLIISFVYNNEELTSASKEIDVVFVNETNLTKEQKISKFLEKKIKIENKLTNELMTKEKVRVILKTKKGVKSIGKELEGLKDFEVVELNEFNLELLDELEIEEIVIDQPISLLVNDSEQIIKSIAAKNEFNRSGQGKKICIIDTGVDGSVTNYSIGFDFVNNDSDASDDNGHGTQVAYISKSIAPDSELLVAKVLDANGNGYESNVLEGLQWCINNNASIISFSIGAGSYDGFCDANIVAELANSAVTNGIFVAAATGNDGSTLLKSPACASSVTRVSATDKQDNIASFSNVNEALDVFAPGVDIATQTIGGSVTIISGTSASVPFVSGAAALILENESLTPLDLRYRLASTGKPILYSQGDLMINISRLDVYNAVINNITMIPYNATLNQTNVTNMTNFTILQSPMAINLTNPVDGFVNNSYPTNINFSCSVSDGDGIANVSLYTNTTGTWHLNQTKTIYSPISDVTNHYNTVYLGNGIYRMTIQPNATYGKDTYVIGDFGCESFEGDNYGDSISLALDRTYCDDRILLEFNSTELQKLNQPNINIINSTLALVKSGTGYSAESKVYRILAAWNESNPNGVSWSNQPNHDLFLYNNTTVGTGGINSSLGYNITELVKSWINGTNLNYGLKIISKEDFFGNGEPPVLFYSSDSTTNPSYRPKLVIDYQVKSNYTANFSVQGIDQGHYIWNCRAFDSEGNSGFAPSNFSLYVDPCLPPTEGNWNIGQNCVVSNRVITLARDKNLQVNNPGSLALVNTTLIINGSSNGASNINVNTGGNISLSSNSEIKSANSNKFGFIVNVGSNFSMVNSTLRSAVSLDLYGNIKNFTGNYLNASPVNVYTSNNVLKLSTFEKSNLNLKPSETEDTLNNTVDGNTFVGSSLIIVYSGLSSYNNTIMNNIFESIISGTQGAIDVSTSSNLIKNNTINRANKGIRFNGISGPSYNNLIDNLISNSTSFGILTSGGATLNNYFYRNTLINNSKGISMTFADDNNLFVDNIILNNTGNDIENAGNNNTFINTTFDKSKVSVTGGYIIVKWYLDVNVSDSNYGVGVNQSNVTGWNVSSYPNGQPAFTDLTEANGFIDPRQNVTEYIQYPNPTGIVYATNYTINTSKTEYLNDSQQLNLTNSTQLNIKLHALNQYDTCSPSYSGANLIINTTVSCSDKTIEVNSLNVTSTGIFTLTNVTFIVKNTTVGTGGSLKIINSKNTIWQNGNLTINGYYLLQNSTLRMNGTGADGNVGINVASTGNMNITQGSNITNGQDVNYNYFFIVNSGSTFSMDNSYLSYAGWDESPGAYGLQLGTTAARFEGNTLKNNYLGVILYFSNNNIIRSNLVDGNLLTGIGILTGNNNTLTLNNITNNPYGIAMDALAGNNYIISNNLSNNDNAIYISGSSNNLVNSSLLKDNPTGIFFAGASSNNLIRDSSIINSSTRNIYTEGSGDNIFLNTSFNKSKVYFFSGEEATGRINVQWYLDVNVTDYFSGNVLPGVSVSAWNNTLLNPPVFTDVTESNGLIDPRQNLTEYVQNKTGAYPATNYTINASKTGYINDSKQLNITESTLLTMTLIDPCLPHPTDDWNITQTCVVQDKEIALAQNKKLNILNGGNLTLKNTTLWINGTTNGNSGIRVWSGGAMNITDNNNDGSLINSTSTNIHYFFIVNSGSNFSMTNSQLEEAGWNFLSGQYGLSVYTTISRFEGNILKNNYVGLTLESSNNVIKSNLFDSNSYIGVDISIYSNNTLISNNITNNQYGISLDNLASNNYVISNNITNNQYGILFSSSNNNLIIDSNITNSASKDIEVTGSGGNILLNTLFDKNKILFSFNPTGKIDVKWYLDVNVKNSTGNNLQGVNVTARNVSESQTFSELTDVFGNIVRQNLTEYVQNITNKYFETNYTINATIAGYSNYSTKLNITSSTLLNIVMNSPPFDPLVNIASADGTNRSMSNLNCSALISDPNADNLNVSVRWYKNDILNLSFDYNNSYPNGTLFNATLASGNLSKGQNWSCSARAYDGFAFSNWVNSTKILILNSPPNVTLSLPVDNENTTNRNENLSWFGDDPDGKSDIEWYEVNISLLGGGGQTCIDNRGYSNISNVEYYVVQPYLKCLKDDGYYYHWSVRASDGEEFGSWSAPRRLNVESFVSINLTRDKINFGMMLPNEINDTADNNPLSLLIENIGNVFVNVSINATNLWVSVANPSQYYRYKIDNSPELNSFNWQLSKTSWRNVTNQSTQELAIARLNWSNLTDSAEGDIYVQVPDGEIAGIKSSLIVFSASRSEEDNQGPVLG